MRRGGVGEAKAEMAHWLPAGINRRHATIVALGAALPFAGLLISTLLGELLTALGRSELFFLLLGAIFKDPIYTQIAKDHLTQLAISHSQVGLMSWGPGLYVEGTVLARTVIAFGTGIALLGISTYLVRLDLDARWLTAPRFLIVVGYHAAALNTFFDHRVTAASVEKLGLAAVITKLGGNDAGFYDVVAIGLELLLPAGFLAVFYGYVLWKEWIGKSLGRALQPGAAIAVSLALALPFSPFEAGDAGAGTVTAVEAGHAQARGRSVAVAGAAAGDGRNVLTALSRTAAGRERSPSALGGLTRGEERPALWPSLVEVRRTARGFDLVREGKPVLLRGMGYNQVVEAGSDDERQRKWKDDLTLIAASGFNTLVGWVDRDRVEPWPAKLLDIAWAEGLGVVLPFDLPSDANYGDPGIRARYRKDVAAWVRQNKDHPALLMWGLGNEVLHGIGKKKRAEAAEFAAFYWELADLVHDLDPRHPVTYRGGEEHYIGPLLAAYERSQKERPWFALGMNVYNAGPRPAHFRRVLYELWPARKWNVAAYVSEFNALGLDAQTRPRTLAKMWRVILEKPGAFLGGAVYVWSTAGPEVVDRSFGLVDGANRPVDGALGALRREFLRPEPEEPADRPSSRYARH